MTDRQKSHFGTDGYKDIKVREEASKRKKSTSSKNPLDQRRMEKENMVKKLRKENDKLRGN